MVELFLIYYILFLFYLVMLGGPLVCQCFYQRHFVLPSVNKDFTLHYVSLSALSSSISVSNAMKYL